MSKWEVCVEMGGLCQVCVRFALGLCQNRRFVLGACGLCQLCVVCAN